MEAKITEIVGENEKVIWTFSDGQEIGQMSLFLGSILPHDTEAEKVKCPIFVFHTRKREYWEAPDEGEPYELKSSQREIGEFFCAQVEGLRGKKFKILSPDLIEKFKQKGGQSRL